MAVQNALANGEPLSLLMFDIDHFKSFNDSYGHLTGDQVLRLVGMSLKQTIKGQDITARYGGEEFAVVLPNTALRQALTVADHIRRAVMAKELKKKSTGEILGRVTISVGVSMLKPGDDTDSLIERADACLYAAKRNGRNRVICEADPGIRRRDPEPGRVKLNSLRSARLERMRQRLRPIGFRHPSDAAQDARSSRHAFLRPSRFCFRFLRGLLASAFFARLARLRTLAQRRALRRRQRRPRPTAQLLRIVEQPRRQLPVRVDRDGLRSASDTETALILPPRIAEWFARRRGNKDRRAAPARS